MGPHGPAEDTDDRSVKGAPAANGFTAGPQGPAENADDRSVEGAPTANGFTAGLKGPAEDADDRPVKRSQPSISRRKALKSSSRNWRRCLERRKRWRRQRRNDACATFCDVSRSCSSMMSLAAASTTAGDAARTSNKGTPGSSFLSATAAASLAARFSATCSSRLSRKALCRRSFSSNAATVLGDSCRTNALPVLAGVLATEGVDDLPWGDQRSSACLGSRFRIGSVLAEAPRALEVEADPRQRARPPHARSEKRKANGCKPWPV
mmetsp:Transcript_35670/g.115617  ORF Transcript_35670/g.115617 Transcript_35670/m.115617 type:complete len:265 (+) Transcript_35670:1856-2650(+)